MFYLQDNIVGELAVEERVVFPGSFRAVCFRVTPVLTAVIDKAAPDYHAAKWLQRFRQHVGTFRMIPAVGERTGPTFTVRLYQKAGKIGNGGINAGRSFLPPGADCRIQGIRSGYAVTHRLGKVHRNHQTDPEGTEQIRKRSKIRKIILQQKLGGVVDVYVVDAQDIQSGRRQKPSEHADSGNAVVQTSVPEEKASSGITPFDFSVRVVPAVDHPKGVFRRGGYRFAYVQTVYMISNQPVCTVEQTCISAGQSE